MKGCGDIGGAGERFSRTELLVGPEGMARLQQACVAVIGLGGVGSYAFEAIVRGGVERVVVVDGDRVEPTNVNRQLLALEETVGRLKVDAAVNRAKGINPAVEVVSVFARITPENVAATLSEEVGFVVDAIDSVSPKVALIQELHKRGVPFVSCMGAAERLDPLGVELVDISETKGCPLARRVRLELRKLGISRGVRCLCFREEERGYRKPGSGQAAYGRKREHGCISYVPGILGLTAAGVILHDILAGDLSRES